MINNSSDARQYKRSTGHSKQKTIKYQQKRFSEQRGNFQSFQINSNPGLSLIHEKVHQDLEVLKTQVLKEIFLVTSRIRYFYFMRNGCN